MRIYEERNKKRDISCGYCYQEGHNKRHCPHMKQHWDANVDLRGLSRLGSSDTIKGVDNTMFDARWRQHYTDSDAKRQFISHWSYMSNRFSTTPTETKTKKRKKAKCGFCGSTAHNRRNCNKLKNFVYVLNETNKAYRAEYYDKFIDGMGLGAGALLSIRNPYSYGDKTNQVAILTSFPTDSIMFTNLRRSWSEYGTTATSNVLIEGHNAKLSLTHDAFFDEDDGIEHDIWRVMFSRWGRIMSVISPAPNKPSKEWFTGQSPCYDWVVKKRDNYALMQEFSGLIKRFYPHNNLRAKLGAKVYDSYYTR